MVTKIVTKSKVGHLTKLVSSSSAATYHSRARAHTHTHTRTRLCPHVGAYIYIYTCVCVCVCVCTYIRISIYIHIKTYIQVTYITHTHTHKHMRQRAGASARHGAARRGAALPLLTPHSFSHTHLLYPHHTLSHTHTHTFWEPPPVRSRHHSSHQVMISLLSLTQIQNNKKKFKKVKKKVS